MELFVRSVGIAASLLAPLVCGCSGSTGDSNPVGSEAGSRGSAGSAGNAGSAPSVGGSGGQLDGGGGGGGTTSEAGSSSSAGAGAGAGAGAQSGGSAGNGTSGSSGGAGQAGQAGTGLCPFTSAEYFLWSGAAPGNGATAVVEKIAERSADPQLHDRSITGVSKPSVFAYLAAHPNGAAAVVIPGGGYEHIAFDKEGVDIATWLNSLGVSAFILKYRLPTNFPGLPWIPLADAQRAIRTIRKAAAACAIDPARLGVIGFSAGGHLASQLETRFSTQTSAHADDTDAVDARPAFGVLMYPVISMDPAIAHAGSKTALLGASPTAADVKLYSSELQVTATTAPSFIGVSNQDKTVNPQNSIRFDDALKTAGIAQEFQLYQDGAHGVGIRDATGDMAAWPQQCASWLTAMKLLGSTSP
jgi:acetyl esterase/lipase